MAIVALTPSDVTDKSPGALSPDHRAWVNFERHCLSFHQRVQADTHNAYQFWRLVQHAHRWRSLWAAHQKAARAFALTARERRSVLSLTKRELRALWLRMARHAQKKRHEGARARVARIAERLKKAAIRLGHRRGAAATTLDRAVSMNDLIIAHFVQSGISPPDRTVNEANRPMFFRSRAPGGNGREEDRRSAFSGHFRVSRF